jgi:hypothetical protein
MGFRLRAPSPTTVIACIALFLALGGGGYMALAHGGAGAAKKKHKATPIPGPAGPAGPAGPQGATGPPGAARAYAHVSQGNLVAADSTGISAMTRGCKAGALACPAVPGSESTYAYCFQLNFTPTSVQVTPDGGQTNSDDSLVADSWSAHVPGRGPSMSHDGCPPGYKSAEVDGYTSASFSAIVPGLYITFN